MIDYKELRCGNYIGWKEAKFPFKVTEISDVSVNLMYSDGGGHSWCYDLDECAGIDLTPELLERCGLNERFFRAYQIKPLSGKDMNGYWGLFIRNKFEATRIKYVHQLQNLYFALTGKELEIKF